MTRQGLSFDSSTPVLWPRHMTDPSRFEVKANMLPQTGADISIPNINRLQECPEPRSGFPLDLQCDHGPAVSVPLAALSHAPDYHWARAHVGADDALSARTTAVVLVTGTAQNIRNPRQASYLGRAASSAGSPNGRSAGTESRIGAAVPILVGFPSISRRQAVCLPRPVRKPELNAYTAVIDKATQRSNCFSRPSRQRAEQSKKRASLRVIPAFSVLQ
ncbi:predicted protein [Chaetomium globosum CBS 148.51]|uniref:Uncharacterized protein n=1 Tax=Chaetomium globosum (strain ATCC 6205 / CBS 148.51 / DSM 1962 / NBRC 6347 / NRRL 1970) TaxID=306901 RepID=Q2GWC6_CHAGB|nr:uncharacterized protein CHGG_07728 [Chaetomium globosum CBS 148.51]EAQ86475.1 predicted protein [Chaetomium globosum CBS 148.51]